MDGNDFLFSLLDRAQGRAAVLERRQPARFEPAARVTGPGLVETQATNAGDPSEREASPVRYSPHAPEPGVQPGSTSPVEPLAFPREERPAQVHENFRPALRHEVTETRIETRAVVEKVIEREVEKTKIVSAGPPLEPAARGVHTEIAAVRAPGVVARQGRVVEPAESRIAPQRTEPSKVAPIVERRIPNTQVAIQSLIRPAARPATVSPVRREEPQAAAPDIHITIGRIDIRALPSSARAEGASRRSGPKLDLENYLRSRAGGRA